MPVYSPKHNEASLCPGAARCNPNSETVIGWEYSRLPPPRSRDRQRGFVSAHNWAQHMQSIQQYSCMRCPNTPHTVGLLYIIQTTRYQGLSQRSAPGVGDAAQEQAAMLSAGTGGGAGTCCTKQPKMLREAKKS